MLSQEERLRKAIDRMNEQDKRIRQYEKEIEKKNELIESNNRMMSKIYDEMNEYKEKGKALVTENEDLIATLENAKKVIENLEHDARIGSGFIDLVKSINIEN